MKLFAILSLFVSMTCLATTEPAHGLADGFYEGAGQWETNDGQWADYVSWMDIDDNIVRGEAVWAGGGTGYWLDFDFYDDNHFNVFTVDHVLVGEGYCVFDVELSRCEYAIAFADVQMSEVWHIDGDERIVKEGVKYVGDLAIHWRETLWSHGHDNDDGDDNGDDDGDNDDGDSNDDTDAPADPGAPSDDVPPTGDTNQSPIQK